MCKCFLGYQDWDFDSQNLHKSQVSIALHEIPVWETELEGGHCTACNPGVRGRENSCKKLGSHTSGKVSYSFRETLPPHMVAVKEDI